MRAFLVIVFCLAAAFMAGAEEISATASLSQGATSVGDPVELQIKVTGTQRVSRLQHPVDGLEITYEGSSTQVQLNNFVLSTSVVETYSVKPLRAGKFIIPGEVLDAGGTRVATNSVTLNVSRDEAGVTARNTEQLAFGEIVLPKQTAFVGEMLPVELRIYVDARVRWNFQDPPEIGSPGFTMQKLTQPAQSEVRRNGRPFNLLIFKTAIAPVKAGKLTFGPATISCQAQIPQNRPAIPHFFGDDSFANPFGMFSPPQEYTIKVDSVAVEAKALPPGPPKSFSGAVGSFTLASDASPSHVNVGEPITLTASVSGWGNLDGVRAPVLNGEDGWRVYPPASKIKTEDDVGIRGAKTFQTQMIPLEKKNALPEIEFSYFNPIRERYVTLTGKPLPVTVAGESVSTPTPASLQNQASAPQEPRPANGILYIRTDPGNLDGSFQPPYATRGFWVAQLVPLCALAGLVVFQRRQEKARTAKARQLAALRREKQALWRILRGEEAGYAAFADAAARLVQVDTAFATGGNASLVDAEYACASRPLGDSAAAAIRSVFSDREAMNYAGVAVGSGPVPPRKRAEILAALEEFDHANV